MKHIFYLFLFLFLLCHVSCNKSDESNFIDPFFRTLDISGGIVGEIPVLADNWYIESVQEMPSGIDMLDENNKPMMLSGNGTTNAANGWLSLMRENDKGFTINLRENFDKTTDRKFIICINAGGMRDYVRLIQHVGSEYELIKSEYEEWEEAREIYTTNEGCYELELSNNTSEAVWKPTGYIFKDVVETSIFESDDYGAFDWTLDTEIKLKTPDLIIDNQMYWSALTVYKKGIATIPFVKDIEKGSTILVQPYSYVSLKGEMTYCKRIYKYTFTIKNKDTGSVFQIEGRWTHITPVSSNTIAF